MCTWFAISGSDQILSFHNLQNLPHILDVFLHNILIGTPRQGNYFSNPVLSAELNHVLVHVYKGMKSFL